MDAQTALTTAEVFQHGFSAGAAFVLVVLGLYAMFCRTRRDP